MANTTKSRILIIDDEKNILTSLNTALSLEGFDVTVAGSGEIGLKKIEKESVDLVLLDVQLPGIDGLDSLKKIRKDKPRLPVVMMSGHGTIQTALEAIRLGAVDFIEKPLSTERLIVTIRNALHIEELVRENIELKSGSPHGLEIIGSSKVIKDVLEKVRVTAPTNSRVLISGENGTGKELIARAIHLQSFRSDKPFIKVNCAAIPAELIESELFGHVKGAFTGAMAARRGKFELADGGTIFLDEIGDMKLEMQSKLLRVLQEGEFEPVGSESTISVDVRVLSATNRNLENMIKEDLFRQDLFYRLAVIPIQLPALRERLEDIPELIKHFSDLVCAEYNRMEVDFDESAETLLKKHNWPGNVREIKNTVERLIILNQTNIITENEVKTVLSIDSDVSSATGSLPISGRPLKDLVTQFEKIVIEKSLEDNSFNVSNSAKALGLERSHLYKKMRAFGINPRK